MRLVTCPRCRSMLRGNALRCWKCGCDLTAPDAEFGAQPIGPGAPAMPAPDAPGVTPEEALAARERGPWISGASLAIGLVALVVFSPNCIVRSLSGPDWVSQVAFVGSGSAGMYPGGAGLGWIGWFVTGTAILLAAMAWGASKGDLASIAIGGFLVLVVLAISIYCGLFVFPVPRALVLLLLLVAPVLAALFWKAFLAAIARRDRLRRLGAGHIALL